ncbi:aminoglycoside phosphotransferase family protein [Amycolatopsis sp. PS_44_ISF1]|uniref:aminoglycoside phosphotransferase family protein n=1 Tax=Amycolatopsis sp. PS_44_ISF1 TaxID=2974917 RepID=UPI0028DF7696|nr:aminoglycoside phosphotransferase family protein [Amycolatopsis sp. PS_44_ISF1]MDT8912799.1 aminoglycoside phosphotransferase family protein [Amycolatopsis sp. PS_44_ISF1]
MILDDAARARLIDRFGRRAGPWCDELPALVARLAARWGLTVLEARPGNTGRTLVCRGSAGESRVLKLCPDQEIAAAEATALQTWAGRSRVVQVVEADFEAGALLLEGLEPGTPLTGRGADLPWAEVAELLAQLHSAPAAGPFPTLATRIGLMFELAERRRLGSAAESRLPLKLLRHARSRAEDLSTGGPAVLLHGDLHPGNVLDAGPGRGLVAIDPRPCLGDPAFDAVDWALLPMAAGGSLEDGVAALPDLDPGRLRAWCAALAPLVALAPLRAGPPTPFTEALLEMAR